MATKRTHKNQKVRAEISWTQAGFGKLKLHRVYYEEEMEESNHLPDELHGMQIKSLSKRGNTHWIIKRCILKSELSTKNIALEKEKIMLEC